MFFINTLSGAVRAIFLRACTPDMPFFQFADFMRKKYNSEAQQEHLVDTLYAFRLSIFLAHQKRSDEKEGLRQLLGYIKQTTTLLPAEYQNEKHKIRIMQNALVRITWTQIPISQIYPQRFNFHQFSTAL